MDEYSREDKEYSYPQLLDLIPRKGDWAVKKEKGDEETFTEDRNLELSLGPPGGREKNTTSSSFGTFFSNKKPSSLLKLQIKEPHVEESEKKVASSKPPLYKRASTGQVVGWPPVRSFRKNLSTGSCSKLTSDSSPSSELDKSSSNSLFVKINMDGVPIGRKIDLKAYNSYEKLKFAVNHLFRGLIPGNESSTDSIEYTLVYEDHECDQMLVGDVPWDMFITNVKRL